MTQIEDVRMALTGHLFFGEKHAMAKQRLLFGFKIVCSTFLVCYLALTVDWPSLGHALYKVKLGYFGLSFVLVILSNFILAAKYSLLIEGSSIQHSLMSLFKINLISRFYSVLLPPAVGPEMIRWFKITRNQQGKVFFMAASVFERAGFVLVSLVIGAVFLYLSPLSNQIEDLQIRLLPFFLFSISLVLFFHVFFLSRTVHHWGGIFLEKMIPRKGAKSRIVIFYDKFFLNNRSAKLVIGITSLSFCWHFVFLFCVFLMFLALSIPLSFMDVAWMGSLVFLLQLLPLSLAGIGLREGALAFMFIQVGLPPEQGVAAGVLLFINVLLLAAVGGLLELSEMMAAR